MIYGTDSHMTTREVDEMLGDLRPRVLLVYAGGKPDSPDDDLPDDRSPVAVLWQDGDSYAGVTLRHDAGRDGSLWLRGIGPGGAVLDQDLDVPSDEPVDFAGWEIAPA